VACVVAGPASRDRFFFFLRDLRGNSFRFPVNKSETIDMFWLPLRPNFWRRTPRRNGSRVAAIHPFINALSGQAIDLAYLIYPGRRNRRASSNLFGSIRRCDKFLAQDFSWMNRL
jgi:hypothetical protein